ncbi:SDR family NAD(P)-dependent oxidoreductase [Spirosoma sp.]|uniref:SDR family NAD(P)-dependent oxidoreductase n=1 Tax=Spirosoma sp. TaxID=1899569 RepID=UPI003B3B6263
MTDLRSSQSYSTTRATLITGASRGIGRAIAQECAMRGHNLILVALPGESIDRIKQELINRYAIQVFTHETDLTNLQAPQRLYDWCLDNDLTVDTLINNAGIGQQGAFESLVVSGKLSLMQLNMLVPVNLVHLFLPMLRQHPVSYILNVGSVASFSPIPYKSLYSASKAFILTLSRALRYELRHTSVQVSCLCPGPTLTNEQTRLYARSLGRSGTLLEMAPGEVARYAVAGMLAGREIIVPGWKHKLVEMFARYLPKNWTIPASGRLFAQSLSYR